MLVVGFLALLDVGGEVAGAEGALRLLDRQHAAAAQLHYQEDHLEDVAGSDIDFLLRVSSTVLGQNEFRPQILHDPMRKIVMLVHIDPHPHLMLAKLRIVVLELGADALVLPLEGGAHGGSLGRLHEGDDVLAGDVQPVQEERVLHRVLAQEVQHFQVLQVVLLEDQEVQLLPLLADRVERPALLHELPQLVQNPQVLLDLHRSGGGGACLGWGAVGVDGGGCGLDVALELELLAAVGEQTQRRPHAHAVCETEVVLLLAGLPAVLAGRGSEAGFGERVQ